MVAFGALHDADADGRWWWYIAVVWLDGIMATPSWLTVQRLPDRPPTALLPGNDPGHIIHTHVPLSRSSIILYWPKSAPSTASLPVRSHCATAKRNRCKEDLNGWSTPRPLKNCRRPPGRPCTTWMKTTQQDLDTFNLSLNEAIDFAQNLPLWRLMSTFGVVVHEWMKARRCSATESETIVESDGTRSPHLTTQRPRSGRNPEPAWSMGLLSPT